LTTTTQLRNWWAPACTGPWATVNLYGEGRVTVRVEILAAVAALNACLKAHNYPTRRADTGGYNCRKITGGTGYSLHAFAIAVDLNWTSNPYGPRLVTDMPPAMVADIKAIRTRNGRQVWRWGGDYAGSKDAMHFEVCCSPADLATGIASPTDEELTMSDVQAILDRLNAIELRLVAAGIGLAEFDDDVPENLSDQLGEIRRNLRKTAAAAGVAPGDIES
jgi:hypothetical protein